jgi:hypothetical protein
VVNRAEVLDKAKAAVADREGKYGHPRENFERIARRWNVHLQNKHGNLGRNDLDADDVAIMLVDVKLARAESGVYHPDNFIDVAGYAALAAEVGAPTRQEQPSADMLKGVNTRAAGRVFRVAMADNRGMPVWCRCRCDPPHLEGAHDIGCPAGDYLRERDSRRKLPCGCVCDGKGKVVNVEISPRSCEEHSFGSVVGADDYRDTINCTCGARIAKDIHKPGCPLGDYLADRAGGGLAK